MHIVFLVSDAVHMSELSTNRKHISETAHPPRLQRRICCNDVPGCFSNTPADLTDPSSPWHCYTAGHQQYRGFHELESNSTPWVTAIRVWSTTRQGAATPPHPHRRGYHFPRHRYHLVGHAAGPVLPSIAARPGPHVASETLEHQTHLEIRPTAHPPCPPLPQHPPPDRCPYVPAAASRLTREPACPFRHRSKPCRRRLAPPGPPRNPRSGYAPGLPPDQWRHLTHGRPCAAVGNLSRDALVLAQAALRCHAGLPLRLGGSHHAARQRGERPLCMENHAGIASACVCGSSCFSSPAHPYAMPAKPFHDVVLTERHVRWPMLAHVRSKGFIRLRGYRCQQCMRRIGGIRNPPSAAHKI